MPIPIIDLFAGPGGLNEGFSRVEDARGGAVFETVLSVEKDEVAHQTLELRALYRRLRQRSDLKKYWEYVRGGITREELFTSAGDLADAARAEALNATLGVSDAASLEIEAKIARQLQNAGSADCVLIGGPPCQAYSLVGRARRRHEDKEEFESDQLHVLYREYLRIVARFRPMVFVMENVPGLLSAKLKGNRVFQMICDDLRAAGYDLYPLNEAKPGAATDDPKSFVIEAERHGVPQARSRVFILGLRSDLHLKRRAMAKSSSEQVTIADAIADLPRIRSRLSREPDSADRWLSAITEPFWGYSFAGLEPAFRSALYNRIGAMHAHYPLGARSMERVKPGPVRLSDWFGAETCDLVLNHNSRGHMRRDLLRYFFWAEYASHFGRSPTLEDVPHFLRPNHLNVIGDATDLPFADRFRVQIRSRPSTTVVSHIAKDGHYYIHYEPKQCRSLSVREAARLQTFPDDYFFEGPVTEQYFQVGNAVPPYLAKQIGNVVHSILRGQ